MIVRRLSLFVALAFAGLAAGAAWSACPTPGACTCVISLSSLNFGAYNPQTADPTDTVGTLVVSCISPDPANSTFNIALSPGSSGNANARTMMLGSHPLYYNLYTNVARTDVWGDGSGGGESVVSGFSLITRTGKNFNIYGRIPALQNVWAGTYHDAITVTVAY